MPKFCSNCGKEVADGMAFCQECGAKIEKEVASDAEVTEQIASVAESAAVVQPAAQSVSVASPAEEEKFKTVKTSTYFWLGFVFSLPVIGLIVNLIVAFAPKNKNLKNFAKSKLVWLLVLLIISIICALIGFIAGQSFLSNLGFSSFGELIQNILNGGFSA